MNDADLAARIAEDAGRIALDLRASGRFAGRELGDAGDRAANAMVVETLRRERPADGLLSEESRDDGTRLAHERVWIVDPIDGTREYAEGRSDWAVHIGLAIGGVARLGAVALPDRGLVLRSDRPVPLDARGDRRSDAPPRIVVSRSRPPAEALALAEALGGELIAMGSAGAKTMAVVQGEAEIYCHSGGQHEWDSCAPVAVASAHGLVCTRLDGETLRYNCARPYLPDLLVCHPSFAPAALAALADIDGQNHAP